MTSAKSFLNQVALTLLAILLIAGQTHAHVNLNNPNGGEELPVGTDYTIQWTLAVEHDQLNWDLYYSNSGPAGPWIPIETDIPVGDPTSGSVHAYSWTVPDDATDQARVRIVQDNNGLDYEDISTADFTIGSPTAEPPPITTELTASGLVWPVFLTTPEGDQNRLFVAERKGKIRIIKDGVLQAEPFLDIEAQVESEGEQGILGMAFHPDYFSNGYFYVFYTAEVPNGEATVSRFSVSSTNPDSADISSESVILTLAQSFPNHAGGMMEFGPNDGYLYVSFGDGGGSEDPNNSAQNPLQLYGKIIRIDVDVPSGYVVPGSNPYVDDGSTLDEIWATGFRNPWRSSFDRLTGDLWIADVGQDLKEEVNYQPSSSAGGENYGWRLKEGSDCFIPSSGCDPSGVLDDPIFEYDHVVGPYGYRCSITGGYVYRGCAMPYLDGTYFYGDYCSGEVWGLTYDGATLSEPIDMTSALFGVNTILLVSFGQDWQGELYILEYAADARVFKIVPDGLPDQCTTGGCGGLYTGGVSGNANCSTDGKITLSDITALIDHVYISKLPLCCAANGNANGSIDCKVTLSDITRLIDAVYISKAPPEDVLPECDI